MELEIIEYTIDNTYMLFIGGFFVGIIIYFVVYSIFSLFRIFIDISKKGC